MVEPSEQPAGDEPASPEARSSLILVRVGEPGQPAFRLRKGEEGISVFDPAAVDPPLTEAEILDSFRPGSQVVIRPLSAVEAKGLRVTPVEGAAFLPDRLRQAHREIQAGPGMARQQFKNTLKELE